jgi:hypothetical protein
MKLDRINRFFTQFAAFQIRYRWFFIAAFLCLIIFTRPV